MMAVKNMYFVAPRSTIFGRYWGEADIINVEVRCLGRKYPRVLKQGAELSLSGICRVLEVSEGKLTSAWQMLIRAMHFDITVRKLLFGF